MVFTTEDKIVIKDLVPLKDYSTRRLIKEFPSKGWNKNGLDKLLRKIRSTGSVDRKPGSGRPHSMSTAEKIDAVQDLVLSQEDKPQTHRSTRQISRETGISQRTVVRIIHEDLKLKCLKKTPRATINKVQQRLAFRQMQETFEEVSGGKCRFHLVY